MIPITDKQRIALAGNTQLIPVAIIDSEDANIHISSNSININNQYCFPVILNIKKISDKIDLKKNKIIIVIITNFKKQFIAIS